MNSATASGGSTCGDVACQGILFFCFFFFLNWTTEANFLLPFNVSTRKSCPPPEPLQSVIRRLWWLSCKQELTCLGGEDAALKKKKTPKGQRVKWDGVHKKNQQQPRVEAYWVSVLSVLQWPCGTKVNKMLRGVFLDSSKSKLQPEGDTQKKTQLITYVFFFFFPSPEFSNIPTQGRVCIFNEAFASAQF